MHTLSGALCAAVLPLTVAACGDFTDGGATNAEEVITTVILSFAPSGGGTPATAEFDDPDGDGGDPPTVQPVNLVAGTTYTLTVRFQNRLADPVEETTAEIIDESDVHLLLFTGTAVVGPATTNTTGPITQAYADMDVNGLPIGLTDTIMASSGTGGMTVTLRHMPPEEPPQKAADTVAQVKANGIDAIGGSTDARVTFQVMVP